MATIVRSRRSSRSNGVGLLSCYWRRLYAQASMGGTPHYSTPVMQYCATRACQPQEPTRP